MAQVITQHLLSEQEANPEEILQVKHNKQICANLVPNTLTCRSWRAAPDSLQGSEAMLLHTSPANCLFDIVSVYVNVLYWVKPNNNTAGDEAWLRLRISAGINKESRTLVNEKLIYNKSINSSSLARDIREEEQVNTLVLSNFRLPKNMKLYLSIVRDQRESSTEMRNPEVNLCVFGNVDRVTEVP